MRSPLHTFRHASEGHCSWMEPHGFIPTQLSGLVLWLRPDPAVITIATGISQWNDQSGTGDANKNVAQATGSKQPTLNANDAAYNHKPTVSFAAASSQFLISGTWAASLAQPFTVFVAGEQDGNGATQEYWFDSLNIGAQSALYTVTGNTGPSMYAGAVLNAIATTTSPAVYAAQFNGGSSALFQNNSQTAIASGAAGSSGLAGTTIGAAAGGATGNTYQNGKTAEIIVVSNIPSASVMKQVFAYMGGRYAIAVS